jgi:hypothetical protein
VNVVPKTLYYRTHMHQHMHQRDSYSEYVIRQPLKASAGPSKRIDFRFETNWFSILPGVVPDIFFNN